MPLNIEVKGEPASIRTTGDWLRSMSGSVGDCGARVREAGTVSQSGWAGSAGDGFRGVVGRVGTRVDELSGDLGGTAGALDRHADDLDTVRSRMARARRIAGEAGLHATEVAIAEPAPAPPEPTPLPTDRPPSAAERRAHEGATELQAAYAVRVRAYHRAADVVMEARKTEINSQRVLIEFLEGQAKAAPFTIASIASGIAGGTVGDISKYREAAARYSDKAQRALRIVNSPTYAGGRGPSSETWRRAAILHTRNRVNAGETARKAVATRLARAVDRLPPKVQSGLAAKLSKGAPVLKRVPVAGALITAGGVTYEIRQGEDPGKAISSGAVGFGASVATGVAVGAMVGGPVGVVAGAIVGAGVGAVTDFAIDEWAYDATTEAFGSATGWAKDKIGGLFD